MCGRFTQHHTPEEITERFEVAELGYEFGPRYNIAPSQTIPVIIDRGAGRVLDGYQWGLVPSWAKDPAIGNRMINAKAETLAEKPSFRQALSRRRCLIPADGFYEWRAGEKTPKQPFYIRRRDGGLFAFAGLWEEWQAPDGELLRTCTIVTTEPNELLAQIHHRMAAILRPADEAAWLDPDGRSARDLLPLLGPYPAAELEMHRVSREVNAPSNDQPSLLDPVDQ
jgi:putative SOS response-associated peptidase YedK